MKKDKLNSELLNREFFNCDCYTEGVILSHEVHKWRDDDFIEHDIYLTFWNYGNKYQNGTLRFKDKLRWMWQILTKGIPYPDGIILHEDEAERLGNALLKRAKIVKVEHKKIKKEIESNKKGEIK